MNTKINLKRWSWLQQNKRRVAQTGMLLPLLALALPAAVQAQFTYSINNGAVTITGYTGPGGAVTIPSTIVGLPVTSIGDSAFYRCASLTSIAFPNSVTSIGNDAFLACTNLTGVTIPNSVTNIGNEAFAGCSSLTGVIIPNSITTIGGGAFAYCSLLISVTIPSSVTSIIGANRLFEGCSSLAAITVDALNPTYSSLDGVLFNKSQTILIECPGAKAGSYAVPNSVTNIAEWACYHCASLTSLTLGPNVTSIGYNSFAYCSALANVTIPNGVTSIGGQAFGFCASLTTVTIPSSATNVDAGAFWDCSSLAAITVNALNPTYSSVDGVLFNKNQTILIQCPGGKSGNYTVPNSVTNIGMSAFFDCLLINVTIPSSVVNIGNNAFCRCLRMSAITVDAINSVYSSVDGVLLNKGQTTLLQCPGGKTGSYTVPNRVTNIGISAFMYCYSLISVTIPNSVTNIALDAFYECTSLTNVTIGNSVISIGGAAFDGCRSLTSVTIPSSVTSIEYFAFGSCSNLTGIYFKGNAPIVDSTTFQYDNHATVYYLPGTAGWGPTFGGRPTALWPPPTIQTPPQTLTAETGSIVEFRVQAVTVGDLPLGYQWLFNGTTRLSCTNSMLQLPAVQYSQAGAYTVIVTNAAGSVTSPPALLSVIAPVERRIVPALTLMGQPGSTLHLDFTGALGPAALWTTFDHVPLTAASQWYFDLSSPLPPQGFYRAWQSSGGAPPALDLHFIPALTLTGAIGSSVRIDYINQFGPIDAWVTNLATVTLTNTSELYFDTSSIGQPQRLYRVVPLP